MEENANNQELENTSKRIKSELYHIWKKAKRLFELIGQDRMLEDWVQKNINSAHNNLDEALRFVEYEEIFPQKKNEDIDPDEGKNNFLSNQDKRYPVPAESENGDQFITRCILDANMKKRYPVQSDRFNACMVIYTENKNKPSDTGNPGEKFEDPMSSKEPEIKDPIKPILP